MRDIIKKIPKLRGYRFNSHVNKFSPVNVGALNVFKVGSTVSPATLFEMKLIRKVGGVYPKVKILGNGEVNVKLEITGCEISAAARTKIQKAGGTVK
jgi:large subunit ribosomal protein L15